METQANPTGEIYECALLWLEACGHAARKKTTALIQNDLATLEECLEEEGNLISRYTELMTSTTSIHDGKRDVSLVLALKSLTSAAEEVRSANRRNAALIETGMDFSRTLLSVMRPPLTYGHIDQGNTAICVNPGESIFSVDC